jgi:hypothetical protein
MTTSNPASVIEVHPTRTTITLADGSDSVYETTVDQCSPSDADQWSIYERQPDGRLTCICDCPDEATAKRVQSALSAAHLPTHSPNHVAAAAGGGTWSIPDGLLEPVDPPRQAHDVNNAAADEDDDQDGRLAGVITINACRMHVEAIPVVLDDEGTQRGTDVTSEARHEALCLEFGVSGFDTVDIGGKDYVLVITPFER